MASVFIEWVLNIFIAVLIALFAQLFYTRVVVGKPSARELENKLQLVANELGALGQVREQAQKSFMKEEISVDVFNEMSYAYAEKEDALKTQQKRFELELQKQLVARI
ncbi:hypothetical protein HY993_00075 [Candidatus Micrarchaeota archaeon]|nr:hypothetical protein [Candidatus Micrarchaeota archaeon]